MTLANLGAVVYMSNYHTVMTTLANLGAVGCKSNDHTVTSWTYNQQSPILATVVVTVC